MNHLAPISAARLPQTYVYAIRDNVSAAVKIGFSANPFNRLLTLQTGNPNPLRLTCTMPGGEHDEQYLHIIFADRRMEGEWFSDEDLAVSTTMLLFAAGDVAAVNARAEEYDAMAVGCRSHAREIRDFVERRALAAA